MTEPPDAQPFGSLPLPQILHAVFEAVPDFIAVLDLDLRFLFVNRTVPDITAAELRGRSVLEFIDASAHEAARQCFERVLATGRPDYYEAPGYGPHGDLAHYETRVAPVLEGDVPVALAVIARDVSVRKRNELALRDSREQLRLVIAATEMGLWSWDPVGDVISWDARMSEIHGVAPAQAPRTRAEYIRLVHPDDRERLVDRRGYEAPRYDTRVSEYRALRPDGTVRWLQVRGRATVDAEGRVVRLNGGALDITERRESELRAVENQKLEAIGRLTAGIGHNLNNLLTVLLPNLELIAHGVDEPALTEPLDHATHAARRAADLMQQLLVFAGRSRGTPTACDPLALAQRTIALCRGSFDRAITFALEVEPNVPPVAINATLIEQALLNLCLNARDALKGVEHPRIAIALATVPSFVRIDVRDNGPGLDAATRARMFEPFFTTKPVGGGTGLGLSTSYAIVKEHGGTLTCESEPGRGATFSMFLPIASGVAGALSATGVSGAAPLIVSPTAAAHAPRGTEKILVVDDEIAVRAVTGRVLQSGGYRVVLAADDAEALAALGREPFDLVLLDITMPGRTGPELAPSIRALTTAPIVYFSGHVSVDLPEAADVIEKPASRDGLLGRIRAVLDRPSGVRQAVPVTP